MAGVSAFQHPEQIGPYRVVQVLGEGGMGVVYEAEQKEPVRRRVAVKMMKVGMDTRDVVARFEAERQALAVMDHPGIATVFDAGATDEGRPYFVMELVRGVRVDEYCDRCQMSTADRATLFVKVCEAIQHAHQKGVIHRDLKPGNILVTEEGSVPTPKVIDFGVAKATGQRLTEKTIVTTYGQAVGTLAYMSPEQAEMSGLDVDTRADVYSLGIILYELLLGVVPVDPTELGGPAFLARLITRDTPAPTPTKRLTALSHERQSILARSRATDIDTLRRELSSDLQWIVLRAIEKERNRRYDTANELGADLRRFLDHEPVLAHPPSASYRLRKFVRRNTASVAVGAVAAIVLLLAGFATYVSRDRAIASEQVALTEAARAGAVNQFLVEVIGAANPSADGREVRVADLLDRASAEAEDRFGDSPVTEGAVRMALGTTYQGLGLYDEARRELTRSVELYRGIGDSGYIDALFELGTLLTLLGEWDEAEAVHKEVLQGRREEFGEESLGVAGAMSAIGERLFYRGRFEEARAHFRSALDIYEGRLPDDAEQVVTGRSNLSASLQRLGRLEEAAALDEQALAGMKRLKGPDHVDVATISSNLAITLQSIGRYDDAEPLLEDALRIFRAAYGERSDRVARVLNNQGAYYRRVGRLEASARVLREALDMNREVYGDMHREVASNLQNLGLVMKDLGRNEEAAALHLEALEINLAVRPAHSSVPQARTSLAWARLALGEVEEAEALLRQSREEMIAALGESHFRVSHIDSLLGEILRREERLDEALARLDRAVPVLQEQLVPSHEFVRTALEYLARVHDDLGNASQAAEYRAMAAVPGGG